MFIAAKIMELNMGFPASHGAVPSGNVVYALDGPSSSIIHPVFQSADFLGKLLAYQRVSAQIKQQFFFFSEILAMILNHERNERCVGSLWDFSPIQRINCGRNELWTNSGGHFFGVPDLTWPIFWYLTEFSGNTTWCNHQHGNPPLLVS